MNRLSQWTTVFVCAFGPVACSMSSPSIYETLSAENQREVARADAGDQVAMRALFRKSLDPRSSEASDEMVQFLSDVGPDRFLAAWKNQPPEVRRVVLLQMTSVLDNNPDLYDLRGKMLALDRRMDRPD